MPKKKAVREALSRPAEETTGIDCSEIDPEGWMAERPNYWLDLPDPPPPTRAAWLRHRLAQAAALLGAAQPAEPPPVVSEEEWIRLSEMALGPLPRPKKPARQARPAAPDAREPARTREASSSLPPPERAAP